MEEIIKSIESLRIPMQTVEYDLHQIIIDVLTAANLQVEHEVTIAPRCRIDLMCQSVGIEIKRGKPNRSKLVTQLTRYAASEQIDALILVVERNVNIPSIICGKPVKTICLNKLWGIAL